MRAIGCGGTLRWSPIDQQEADRGCGGALLAGSLDPLAACRRIVRLAGDAEREDADIITVVGIESETDHLPDPEHRKRWDPGALEMKDEEIEAYFKHAGPALREACEHLAAKWRGE